MRGNLLTQSQSSANSLQKNSMVDNQFSNLLLSYKVAQVSLTSKNFKNNYDIEPMIIPELISSKVPRHFVTFQEDALRDINIVRSEAFDVHA